MGAQDVSRPQNEEALRLFMKKLLADLRALDHLISNGLIESDRRRIGAEQEMFLVDANRQPAPVAREIMAELNDPTFTHELALFNLEFNLSPLNCGGRCLSRLHAELDRLLGLVRAAAERVGADVVLTGILPTLGKSDLGLENMTPSPRYAALNEAVKRMRGPDFYVHFIGADELIVKHDSVMLEACNTSFQVHFQVSADEFARMYNIAQAVAGPALAAATNSPLLFGRRLWQETRIALFQQALDTRSTGQHIQERKPRVTFGDRWVRESAVEIFRDDIARMRVLIGGEIAEDPFEAMEAGRAPRLQALQLHNGTVYRWNRPCYGVTDGKPHLRIENRMLPAGPTPIDEVANTAFWLGLISGLSRQHEDITTQMSFDDAKTNFIAAARRGLGAQFNWFDGKTIPAQPLILDHLLPVAHEGLCAAGIDAADIDTYLGVIDERVRTEQTGSRWFLRSLARMRETAGAGECMTALVGSTIEFQKRGEPVHTWRLAETQDSGGWEKNYLRVSQYMTTDVFTVNQNELVDLVACLMDWAHIRHVPVEDDDGKLVGLVSYRSLLRMLANGRESREQTVPVREIMHRDPITIAPGTRTIDAIDLMRRHRVSCLPVVKDERLVGIITEYDLTNVARELLEERLRDL